jgi:hypothetical protein
VAQIDRRITDIAHRIVSDSNQFFHLIGCGNRGRLRWQPASQPPGVPPRRG